MFALKSARDQLNSPDKLRLLLVFSGSDRDKLFRLVNPANAPFHGSQIHHIPELDRSYLEPLGVALEKVHEWLTLVNIDQPFLNLQGRWVAPAVPSACPGGGVLQRQKTNYAQAGTGILGGAYKIQQEEIKSLRQLLLGLKPQEQYVLWRMLEQGPASGPMMLTPKSSTVRFSGAR